jgi:predicted enzyme related to lactoylglutathione lyase
MTAVPGPLVNVIAPGVRDIDTLKGFYEALGWPLSADGAVKVFELRGGVLALSPIDGPAADARAEPELGRGGVRFAVEVLVGEPHEVDELAERVERTGGRLTKPPADPEYFEGRSCYFADPERNYFEIAVAPRDDMIVAAARRAAGLEP